MEDVFGRLLSESKEEFTFSIGSDNIAISEILAKSKEEFTCRCIAYSDANGIEELEREFLKRCMEIPNGGVNVENLDYDMVQYPALNPLADGNEQFGRLGEYNVQRGVVVFVYRDGRTFVAKSDSPPKALKMAQGYRRNKRLFVPLAGMKIADVDIRTKWETLPRL